MKYVFKIQGIDCGNCAAKIETKLAQDPMFSHVIMKFMLEKVEVETDETDVEIIRKKIEQIASKVEDGIEVTPDNAKRRQVAKAKAKKVHTHGEGCGCGEHHPEEKHEHTHGEGCGCGGHDHEEKHSHTHGESCGCGDHDHKDEEKTGCGCGCDGHDEKVEHKHTHGEGCGCGSHDHKHEEKQGCGCGCSGHDHKDKHTHGENCGCGDHTTQKSTAHHREIKEVKAAKLGFNKKDYQIWARIGGSFALLLLGSALEINLIITIAYFVIGYDVLLKAAKNISKGKVFDEHFLMTIATIAAFVIGEYPEAVAVMLFYQTGEYFQGRAVNQSRKAIASLMDIKPDFARVKRMGAWIEVAPDDVEEGEILLVRPGEKVPLDGVILSGKTTLDTSMLTGESLPAYKEEGGDVLSGTVNLEQMIEVEVTHTLQDSTVSRVLELIENATSRKTKAENFITKFAAVYTPIVVLLAALIAVIPSLITGNWNEWIYTSITFLVISCPCALVVSVPLSFFGGIGRASREGILIKGSNYLEMLGTIDTVVMDKTGTITKGNFEVVEVTPVSGTSQEELLRHAIYLEQHSNHPIAQAISNKLQVKELQVEGYTEKAGYGLTGKIDGKAYAVGNHRLMEEQGISYIPSKTIGTIIYVAVEGEYKGCIVVSDVVKEDSSQAVEGLKARGIKHILMLTGDKEEVAQAIGRQVGITEVHAGLLPQHKVEKVQELVDKGHKVAFIGDGINDAPVLALSHVGIAMGGIGSDAAVEASDMVLMTDALSQVPTAMDIAKKTKNIVMQNIVFALGVKFLVMFLGIIGIANMWLAIFADVGVSIIAILNAMRILKQKKI